MCLCCAGDSYEMVKENETIEALHERAKIIVDMELLCACIPHPACVDDVNVRSDRGSAALTACQTRADSGAWGLTNSDSICTS